MNKYEEPIKLIINPEYIEKIISQEINKKDIEKIVREEIPKIGTRIGQRLGQTIEELKRLYSPEDCLVDILHLGTVASEIPREEGDWHGRIFAKYLEETADSLNIPVSKKKARNFEYYTVNLLFPERVKRKELSAQLYTEGGFSQNNGLNYLEIKDPSFDGRCLNNLIGFPKKYNCSVWITDKDDHPVKEVIINK